MLQFASGEWRFNLINNDIPFCTKRHNQQTALNNQIETTKQFIKEIKLGYIIPNINNKYKIKYQCPAGLVIKPEKNPRFIRDMKYPYDKTTSFNAHMDPADTGVTYPNIITLSNIMQRAPNGYGTKHDMHAYFRQFCINPLDYGYIAYSWRGVDLIETRVPFGWAGACQKCQMVSDAIIWIINYKLVQINIAFENRICCYMDDIMSIQPTLAMALKADQMINTVLYLINLEQSDHKYLAPTQIPIMIGFELDLIHQTIALEHDKYLKYMTDISYLLSQTKTTYQTMESTLGELRHTAQISWPLKTFTSHMQFNLNPYHDSPPNTMIEISEQSKFELKCWQKFLPKLRKIPVRWILFEPQATITAATDASGTHMGAICGRQWIHVPLTTWEQKQSSTFREGLGVLTLINTFKNKFKNKEIRICCDNDPFVSAWINKSSHEIDILDLVVNMALIAIDYKFRIHLDHIPGVYNGQADAISRCQWKRLQYLQLESYVPLYKCPVQPIFPTYTKYDKNKNTNKK